MASWNSRSCSWNKRFNMIGTFSKAVQSHLDNSIRLSVVTVVIHQYFPGLVNSASGDQPSGTFRTEEHTGHDDERGNDLKHQRKTPGPCGVQFLGAYHGTSGWDGTNEETRVVQSTKTTTPLRWCKLSNPCRGCRGRDSDSKSEDELESYSISESVHLMICRVHTRPPRK